MTDISATIKPKSTQLNADDFTAGPMTIKITGLKLSESDQPVHVHFEGDDGKPWLPCLSMRRVLVKLWGSNGDAYVGQSLTLFCDPKVKWAGKEVGGIRVSHATGIEKPTTIMLTMTRGKRDPYRVRPLDVAPAGVPMASEDLTAWQERLKAAENKEALSALASEIAAVGYADDSNKKALMASYKEATAAIK